MNERVIRAYLETVPEQNIAGYDFSVFQHGKEVFRQMGGYAELESKKPITKETKYRLYSSTKVITCTAALMLLERGKFLLSDPVEKFFPEFRTLSYISKDENGKTETKKCERKMTIKDLFTMSSGLTYEIVPDLIKAGENTGNISTRQLSEILAANPLAYEPGTAFSYGFSHDVLAAIISEIAGMSFGEFLSKYIFEPMELNSIKHEEKGKRPDQLAYTYVYDSQTNSLKKQVEDQFIHSVIEAGGTGLISNTADYAAFSSMLSMGGVAPNGKKIMSRSTIDLMRANHLDEQRMMLFKMYMPGYGYGLGVRTLIDPVAANYAGPIGEFGWSGAAGTYGVIDPSRELTYFYAMQLDSGMHSPVHTYLRNLINAWID